MTEQQRQEIEALQKQLGNRGEDFVLRYERQRLHAHPRVSEVTIIGRHDVGMGYDILSFQGITSRHPDRYIEVKTYSGTPHFFWSQGEQAAARKYGTNYCIYLIDDSKLSTPDYKPLIIQDPINSLDDKWQEKVQSREFTFVAEDCALPQDIDTKTVLVGCYNDNYHLQWILHNHAYNVRQGAINGSVHNDEVTSNVGYLLLYAGPSPRTYRLYAIDKVRQATRSDMLRMGYPNPHAQRYLLYHLTRKIDTPALDIMQILRSYNDKLQRTSGTPIYISGTVLRRFLLNAPTQQGISSTRIYTNEGKPWTSVQTAQLSALYQTGTSIDVLAHKLKRTPQEIKSQLSAQGLLK